MALGLILLRTEKKSSNQSNDEDKMDEDDVEEITNRTSNGMSRFHMCKQKGSITEHPLNCCVR